MFAIGLLISILSLVGLLAAWERAPRSEIAQVVAAFLFAAIFGSVCLMNAGSKEEGREQGRLEILKQQPYYVELSEELERVDKHRAKLLEMRNQMEKMAK